jgi:hypothetical protein
MITTDIFRGVGVEVYLNDQQDFLKIKETLTRIGISSRKEKKLYQSCHLLHKMGKSSVEPFSRYAILHFKELFILDGKENTFTEEDEARRNTIVNLLEEWELLEIAEPEKAEYPIISPKQLKIIPFKEKNQYELISKYTIGRKGPKNNSEDYS